MDKKGFKMVNKKGIKKGFLKNGVFKPNSASSSSSSASFKAKKVHFISEMKRVFRVRNEYMNIREATNHTNDFDFEFLDDREREAFETFHVLMENAEFELLEDPDVVKAIEETDQEFLEEEIDDELIEKLGIRDDIKEKKGYKKDQKEFKKGFLEKGFLKNGVFGGKASSSSSSASSYEEKKRNFISELQRLLTTRNECRKIQEAAKNYKDSIDDREREAFETFNDLMNNAGWALLEDPDVIQVIEQKDCELEVEIADIRIEEPSKRALTAKAEFVEGLKVGREVRIVGGSDIGKKGKVLEVREDDDSVALRFLNGEEVVVWVGNVAYLGSTAEDMCLMKLMEMKSKGKEAEDLCLRKLRNLEIKNSGRFGRNKFY